jgi:hypothetical protein
MHRCSRILFNPREPFPGVGGLLEMSATNEQISGVVANESLRSHDVALKIILD